MLKTHIYNILLYKLEHSPTVSQKKLITFLPDYITARGENILLVKGYAGTGKTTLISSLVNTLNELKIRSVLLAPTGRAAKMLSSYSGHNALTIHKKIYRQRTSKDAFGKFTLDRNLHTNTFFIVDEASMIGNASFESNIFGSGNLLEDLLKYVFNNKNCKLVLVGDTAQLPPVGLSISPALDENFLEGSGHPVSTFFLSDVIRQARESGILYNATNLRHMISAGSSTIPEIQLDFRDIERISGADIVEILSDAYSKTGTADTIVINRSNKLANKYNQGIRNQILERESEIAPGDLLMVVKNNYYWLEESETTNFIANGDIIEVLQIKRYEELYGFRFADAVIRMADYDNQEIDVKLMLDTLHIETASLGNEAGKKLFYTVMEDYADMPSKKRQYEKVKSDPFFNALQVKFAYAVTCHKAQGGQWKNVFIDQGFFKEEMLETEYLRWLYTAFTRATEKLYLVNFKDSFFEGE